MTTNTTVLCISHGGFTTEGLCVFSKIQQHNNPGSMTVSVCEYEMLS